MPIVDLSIPYLVQILEPIALVPQIFKIAAVRYYGSEYGVMDDLKKIVLKEWDALMTATDKDALRANGYGWMCEVDKVNLIECDLLVPRQIQKAYQSAGG